VIAMTMTYDVTDRVLTGQFTAVARGDQVAVEAGSV
jgi:hypothetical protein